MRPRGVPPDRPTERGPAWPRALLNLANLVRASALAGIAAGLPLVAGIASAQPATAAPTAAARPASGTAPASKPLPAGTGAPTAPQKKLSATKRRLLARVIALQQPAVEASARGIVEQSLYTMVQGGRQLLQTEVPPERRDATGREMDIAVRRYRDDVTPIVQGHAARIAPTVIGPLLEARFNEAELRQLIAWLESPVHRKYQEVLPQLQDGFVDQLVNESRGEIEPRLNLLGERLAKLMGMPIVAPPASAASRP